MIPNKTPEELKQIAIDIHNGQIFCDRYIPPHEQMTTVFIILSLLDEKNLEELQKDPPGMIYEYLREAGPRSCNGMPMFMSMRMLSQHDTPIVLDGIKELRRMEDSFKILP